MWKPDAANFSLRLSGSHWYLIVSTQICQYAVGTMEWYLCLLITISHSKVLLIVTTLLYWNITHNYVLCLWKCWQLTGKMFMNDLFLLSHCKSVGQEVILVWSTVLVILSILSLNLKYSINNVQIIPSTGYMNIKDCLIKIMYIKIISNRAVNNKSHT